jgi:ATP-dependent Lhr-like helicase
VTPDAFAPARAWFASQGYTPFAFQEEVWAAYARGESGLIHAPTGMGKTYAAALATDRAGRPGRADTPPALTLLWITPLRALAADTGVALTRASLALQPHWTLRCARAIRRRRRARRRASGCRPRSSPRRKA